MIRLSISSRSILSTLTKSHRPFSSTFCSSISYNVSSQRCGSRGLLLRNVFPKPMAMSSSASSVPNLNSMVRHSDVQLLPATEDEHNGVIVEMHRPIEPQAFSSLLRSSISHWIQSGKRGVWLKLPIEHANLVDAAVQEGFYYHHAEPNYLMLARWLPETENILPPNASHRVGVGAFVLNEKNEVLVVQEKNGMLRKLGVWKFPTGVANEGEDIGEAAAREVKEETGVSELKQFLKMNDAYKFVLLMIDTKFVEVLTFRHLRDLLAFFNRQSHNAFFQKSDLYFVCFLEASSFDIQIQESEILAAKWMSYEEYASQAFVQKHDLLRYVTKICSAKMEGKYKGFSGVSIKASFRPARDCLFLSSEAPNIEYS
ncbi:hypothetical protein V2J09_012309 [Rumex salicifolius]